MNDLPEKSTPLQLLHQYWGYTSFREKQEEIIYSILQKKDTLALLPTGGGKSICFQIPALAQDGICIVITPLIALMQDQVENLKRRGIRALALHSAMSKREIDITLDNAAYGGFKFLYLSPERLETELFQERLKKMTVNLVAIDEAHCISQWGYDFRPSYLKIAALREALPNACFVALTATATPKVAEDIQEKLQFRTPHLIQKSFLRSNLSYVVTETDQQTRKMFRVMDGISGSGIIYVNSRRKTKEITQLLTEHNISADFYHAGLNAEERETKQNNWVQGKTRVIVATNAFGMGIDKPNVRFVIHLDLPSSLEAYFQEAGRAGRDGRKAYAILIVSPSMTKTLEERVQQNFPEIPFIKKTYLCLSNFFQIPINGGLGQAYSFDIREFTDRYKMGVLETYKAIHFLEKEGYLSLSENFSVPSKLHFSLSKEDLYRFQVAHKSYDAFLKTLLRTYGGLHGDYVTINENDIAKNAGLPRQKVVELLQKLQSLEVLNYEAKSSLPKIMYTQARVDQNQLRINKKNYEERKAITNQQAKAVIEYAENKTVCRSQLLLAYFGEQDAVNCDVCDVCLAQKKEGAHRTDIDAIQPSVLVALEKEKLKSEELFHLLRKHNKSDIKKVIQLMLETDLLEFDGLFFKRKQSSE